MVGGGVMEYIGADASPDAKIGGAASIGVSASLPFKSHFTARAEIFAILRGAARVHMYSFDAPLLLEVHLKPRPESPRSVPDGWFDMFVNVGVGVSLRLAALEVTPQFRRLSHVRMYDSLAIAGAGVETKLYGREWRLEARVQHGLVTLDDDTPALDLRIRTWLGQLGVSF